MGGIELCNQSWEAYICGGLPAIVLITVPFPLNEVLESASEYATIQYDFNFVMFLSINQNWVRRWVTLSSQNWIHWCWHQFDHWKDRV